MPSVGRSWPGGSNVDSGALGLDRRGSRRAAPMTRRHRGRRPHVPAPRRGPADTYQGRLSPSVDWATIAIRVGFPACQPPRAASCPSPSPSSCSRHGDGAAAVDRARFPTQSLGNRGADVRAIQGLLLAPATRRRSMASSARPRAMRSRRSRPARPDRRRRSSATTTWAKLIVAIAAGEHAAKRSRSSSGSSTRSAHPGGRRRRLRDGHTDRRHHVPEARRDDATRRPSGP